MKLQANGITLEVQLDGPPEGEPLLLIMGLGMQLVAWPQALVDDFARRGFRVIRLDNRDVGLSQTFDHLGLPNLGLAALRYLLRLPVRAPYRMADMAADALGVLDALGLPQAHVAGASMGGMIAQHLAAGHPQRVKSLGLVMTTTGARHLPQPNFRVRKLLMTPPRSAAEEDVVERLVQMLQLIGSPAYPPEPALLRQQLTLAVRRGHRPAGTARQLLAVVADGDRTPLVRRIQAPTCVLHGAADPLIPAAAGRELAHLIPNSELQVIDGMGHDLPAALLPRIAKALASNAQRASG